MEWLIGLAVVAAVGYYFWNKSKVSDTTEDIDDEML